MGLVPVALLTELPKFKIVSDYCIGANEKVDSVKLYSEVPLEEIKTVVLDYQSRTSVMLARVLNKLFWKKNFEFSEASPGFENEIYGTKAAVVIGDRTFELNGNFPYEYDLAYEWHLFTGLPFVFAAWVATEPLDETFLTEFNDALRFGTDHVGEALNESKYDFPEKFDALDYLKNKIQYKLDDKKRIAIELFLHYIHQLQA